MEKQKRDEVKEGNSGDIQENSVPKADGSELENADQNSRKIVENEAAAESGDNSAGEAQNPAGVPTRSLMLMVLAGIYLVYTGYRLCKNVMDGVEGASLGFMLAGIALFIIGAGMLFIGGRGVIRNDKIRKAEEAAAAAQAAQQPKTIEGEAVEPSQEAGKKMTIADRARLAKRLEDEEETEETEE